MFANKHQGVRVGVMATCAALLLTSGTALAWDDQYLDRMDTITRGVGNAVAHNKAVQMVDPWPRYVYNNKINIDGPRIALGHKRYQANKSIPPVSLGTSNVRFSGSDNGGAGGSSP